MAVSRIYLPSQVPAVLRRQGDALKAAVVKGLRRGAQRGLAEIAQRIANGKPFAPVNTGQYRRSWRVETTKTGATLGSDAPYAGVIELGRRPGQAGPPIGPIREWVYRKFRVAKKWRGGRIKSAERAHEQYDEIERMAWAIRNAIHKKGTAPRHIMTGALRRLGGLAEQEIARACEEAARAA
jgi:hypothetical protein